MQKYLGLAIVLCCLVMPMMARAADPYVVTGVQADVTAATAVKARDQAIRQASRTAFETLAGEISPNKPAPKISDQELGNMVSDFHVEQEQVSANRYIATFTFRFRQNQVRAAFSGRAIASPSELAARTPGSPAAEMSENTVDETAMDQVVAGEAAGPDIEVSQPASPASVTSAGGILVEVPAHDSRELDQAAARFHGVSDVHSVEYVSITPDSSILRLSYDVPTPQLLKQMQASGVSLRTDNSTQPPLYILQP